MTEFIRTMEQVPLGRESTVLEIGSGDGFQLELLKNRFERVFAVDPEVTPAAANGFAKCVAEALPFRDGSFDLVISSSVVEHLADRQRAFAEMRRVLRPGAYAAHIVPTRWWKLTSLVFNPLGYPLRVWEKWQAHRKLQNHHSHPPGRDDPRVGLSQVLRRWVRPPIHGSFPSHWAEYRSFGREEWKKVLSVNGFKLIAEIPLLYYTQFGFCRFHLLSLRKAAADHGWAGSRSFILQAV